MQFERVEQLYRIEVPSSPRRRGRRIFRAIQYYLNRPE